MHDGSPGRLCPTRPKRGFSAGDTAVKVAVIPAIVAGVSLVLAPGQSTSRS